MLVGAVLTSCGTSRTISSTYVASTSNTAVLLTLQVRGHAVAGRIEVAEGSSGPSNTTITTHALEGTLSDTSLDLHSKGATRVALHAKMQNRSLSAVLSLGAGTEWLRLHF